MELNSETIRKLAVNGYQIASTNTNADGLYFRHKNIVQIAAGAFSGYNNLKMLILSYNNIANIPANVFNSLDKLVEIHLSNNKIVVLDENIFSRNVKLEKINLHSNAIKVIHPATFANLNQLKELYLDKNLIKKLPQYLFHTNSELNRIDLDFNLIEEIDPDIFRQNTKLKLIYIQNNKIKTLHSDTFKELPELEELNISDNLLRTFNFNDLKSSKKLDVLRFSNNELQEINNVNNFRSLFPQLTNVSISGNKFQCSYLKVVIECLEQQDFVIDGIEKSEGIGSYHVYGIQCLPDAYALQSSYESETVVLRKTNNSMQEEIRQFKDDVKKQMHEKNHEIAILTTKNNALEATIVELKTKIYLIEEIMQMLANQVITE